MFMSSWSLYKVPTFEQSSMHLKKFLVFKWQAALFEYNLLEVKQKNDIDWIPVTEFYNYSIFSKWQILRYYWEKKGYDGIFGLKRKAVVKAFTAAW